MSTTLDNVRHEIQIHRNGRHESTVYAESYVIATAERSNPGVYPLHCGGQALIGLAEMTAGLMTICAQGGKLEQVMALFENALDALEKEQGPEAIDAEDLTDPESTDPESAA